MQPIDLVIAGIDWLITVDPGRRIIRDAAIAVNGGKIVAIGKSAELAKSYSGTRTVDGRHTVATPGFVDCHLHASFQLSRGLADEANAQSFLFDRMYPYEAALEGEDVRVSATLAGGRAAPARGHLLHRSWQLPSRSIRRRRDVDRHPLHRVALVVRSDEIGARHPAGADDRDRPRRRLNAPRQCWSATPRSGNPRLGASASFRGLNNASDELILGLDKLATQIRHAAADARLLQLFDRTIRASRAPAWRRSSGWKSWASSTSVC